MSRVYYLHEAPSESELDESQTMPTVVEATEEEIQQYYNDSPMLQQTFGDFDTYKSFMGEQADLYDSGDLVKWWELDPDAAGEDQDLSNWLLGNPYIDEGFLDGLDTVDAPFTVYQQQNMSPQMAELYEKYGLPSIDEQSGLYGSVQHEDGADYRWTGTGWQMFREAPEQGVIGTAVSIGVPAFISIATAGALQPIAMGALGGTLGGAVSGVVGSAVGQAVATGGDIDPSALLTAALMGGIGGFANQLSNAGIAEASGGIMGAADDVVHATSELLGVSFNEALNILTGVAEGAVSGDDLESIVAGAVGSFTTAQVKDLLEDAFGATVNVDDWFKDGESHIPVEAFTPIIEGIVQASIEGGMSAEDAVKMAWGYFQNGGDVDFMLPEFTSMVDEWDIPGLDFEKGGWGIGYDEESGDWVINHDIPSIDLPSVDVDIPNPCEEGQILDELGVCQWPDLPEFTNPCEEGQILDDLGVCQWPDMPDLCEEGQILDELGVCQWPDLPDVPNLCEEGQILDEMGVCQWPDVPDLCEEGQILDELGVCQWPDIENPCEEGQILDDMGVCQWPDIENPCEEGQILDELGVCQWPDVPEIEVGPTDCEDGFDWDSLLGQCVEIEIDIPEFKCPEGWDMDDDGTCIEIDIDLPEPPEAAAPKAANTKNSWSNLFQYTSIKNPELSMYAPQLNKVRGMMNDLS